MAHRGELLGRLYPGAFRHPLLGTNHPSTMPIGCDLVGRSTILNMARSSFTDRMMTRAARERLLAYCWSHLRRKFYEIYVGGNSPITTEALARIVKLYAIEAEIRGGAPEVRRAERQARSKPIVTALRPWLEENLVKISKSSPLAEHIRYGLNHWD